jgi:hypothetical protein
MNKLQYIVITALVIIIIYLFQSKPREVEKIITKVDSIVIKSHSTDTVYYPRWQTKKITKIDSFLDTVYILRDYNTKYYYQDTILNDFRGFAVVMDTIYRNRIKSRQTLININERTIYQTSYIQEPKKIKIGVGGGLSGWSDKFGFHVGLAAINKKENMFTLNYDLINKDIRFSYYCKIKLKR